MFDTHVTVVGNLVAEPRLSFTKDGQAVASFRLASTPRRFDRNAGEWRDGDTLFTSVTCWRALAENVSASLKKGCSVIVLGRLSVRPYETKEGDKRQSVEIDAIAVGTDLGRVITVIKRVERGVPIASEATDDAGDDASESIETPAVDSGSTPGATDWGYSGGTTDPSTVVDDDDELDAVADIDDLVVSEAGPEPEAEVAPEPQLASAGGRWRSRG
jgi:single-strand DNA-binding protein